MPRARAAVCLAHVLVGTLSHAYARTSETQDATPVQHGMVTLHTAGAKLLDANGQEVRITGVNWRAEGHRLPAPPTPPPAAVAPVAAQAKREKPEQEVKRPLPTPVVDKKNANRKRE